MTERQWSVSVKDSNGDTSPYAPLRSFNLVWVEPTLLTPFNNTESDGTLFTWEHQGQGGVQTEFAFRRIAIDYEDAWSVAVPGTPSFGTTQRSVSYSPNGLWIAITGYNSPYLHVYNTSDFSQVPGTPSLPNNGWEVRFSADSAYLAVTHRDGDHLTIVDTSDWSIVPNTPVMPTNSPNESDVAWSPDGLYLAVAHTVSPYIDVYDTTDWSKVTGTPTLPSDGTGVTFSHNGAFLAVTFSDDPNLMVINTSDWSQVAGTPALLGSTGNDVRFSHDDAVLAAAHSIGVDIIQTSDWSIIVPYDEIFSQQTHSVDFTPDDNYLVAACHRRFRVIDTSNWSQYVSKSLDDATVRGAKFSIDGYYIAVAMTYTFHYSNRFYVFEGPPSVYKYWNGSDWQTEEFFILSSDEFLELSPSDWE